MQVFDATNKVVATVKKNRSGATAGYNDTLEADFIPPGPCNLVITFYAAANTGIPLVGTASTPITVTRGLITNIGSVTVSTVVASVVINPIMPIGIGETGQLTATAKDSKGNIVAVSNGSFIWSESSGNSSLTLHPDGSIVGSATGNAVVSVSIDGVASQKATIFVHDTVYVKNMTFNSAMGPRQLGTLTVNLNKNPVSPFSVTVAEEVPGRFLVFLDANGDALPSPVILTIPTTASSATISVASLDVEPAGGVATPTFIHATSTPDDVKAPFTFSPFTLSFAAGGLDQAIQEPGFQSTMEVDFPYVMAKDYSSNQNEFHFWISDDITKNPPPVATTGNTTFTNGQYELFTPVEDTTSNSYMVGFTSNEASTREDFYLCVQHQGGAIQTTALYTLPPTVTPIFTSFSEYSGHAGDQITITGTNLANTNYNFADTSFGVSHPAGTWKAGTDTTIYLQVPNLGKATWFVYATNNANGHHNSKVVFTIN